MTTDDSDKPKDSDTKGGFWSTLPGLIAKLTGLIVAVTGLIVALNEAGVKIPPIPFFPLKTTITPNGTTYFDPTKPFLIQLGSDTNPVSAGDEVDRIKELAAQNSLRVDQFKIGSWYVTTIGFFSSRQDAVNFRSLVIQEIPFFQSTDPQIQNIREWCPNFVEVGTHLECQN